MKKSLWHDDGRNWFDQPIIYAAIFLLISIYYIGFYKPFVAVLPFYAAILEASAIPAFRRHFWYEDDRTCLAQPFVAAIFIPALFAAFVYIALHSNNATALAWFFGSVIYAFALSPLFWKQSQD